jgi:hypothetical protein
MLKNNITCVLWLFLAIAVFSSCNKAGVPVDPVDPGGDGSRVLQLAFIKVSKYFMWEGLPLYENDTSQENINFIEGIPWYEQDPSRIGECIVGDDIVMIRCIVDVSNLAFTTPNDTSVKEIVKLTSYKTGDVKYVTLLPVFQFIDIEEVLRLFVCLLQVSDRAEDDNTLKISPDGDIVTAEVVINPKITKTLNIKGIKK